MSEPTLNEILAKIKSTESVQIYIPSLKTDTPFKQLTLSQQRTIIDKVSSTGYGLVDFFISVNEVIKSNCIDSNVYSKLTTIDRVNIILSLRRSLSQTLQNVDLQKLLDKNRNIEPPQLQKTIDNDKFSFEISAPSLIDDTKFNTFLITNYRDEKELLCKLIVTEMCKFVNKIAIVETNTVFDLKSQTVKNKWNILESVESKNLKPIFEYITLIRTAEEEFTKLDDEQVTIGPELFIL
jgi:hypothetical protein